MIQIEGFGVGVVRRIPETDAERWQVIAEEQKQRLKMVKKRLDVVEKQYDKLEAFTTGFVEEVDRRVTTDFATPPAQIGREAVAGRIDERTGQRITMHRETVDWESADWGPPKWQPNGKRYGPPSHAEMVRPTGSPRTGLPTRGEQEDKPAVDHPSLLDISLRQNEIDSWHEYVKRGRRRCVNATINLSAGGIVLLPAAFVLSNIVVFFLSMLTFVLAGFAFQARNVHSHDEAPKPLELHKWNVAENSAALKTQEHEAFMAGCSCPGCGLLEYHQFRDKLSCDPEWAVVIRRCSTCDREWAQK